MKRISFLFLSIVFLILPAWGQQEAGDTELQFAASLSAVTGVENYSSASAILVTKYGSFFTDWLEVGISPVLQWSSTTTTVPEYNFQTGTFTTRETTNEQTTFGGGAFFVIAFLSEDAKTVPYFGGEFYKLDFNDENDQGYAGATVGLKYFFSRKAALDMGGNYLVSLNPDFEAGLIRLTVGISFLF